MKRYSAILLFCFLLPVVAFPQTRKDANVDMAKALRRPGGVQGIVGLLGLDPNKFSMSHSYTLSFASVGGHAINQGLYLNTMTYRLSNPLTMYLQVGLQHQLSGSQPEGSNLARNQLFISRAGFEYKPSENMKLQFEFSQTPSSYYSPYFYDRGFRRGLPGIERESEENN